MSRLAAKPGSGTRWALTIRSVDAVLVMVMVPMRRPLGTSVMGITEAPLVLIDLHTREGVIGRAYLFCYLVMTDLERIGGVSGWLQAAALADAAATEMSSHLYHEVSAHLLAATPTAHWIEYVDWADPILEQPLKVADGCVVPPDRPGTGLTWNADAVARFRRG